MTTAMPGLTEWVTQAPPQPAPPPAPEPGFWEKLYGVAADPAGAFSSAATEYLKAGVVGVLESVWTAGLAMLRDTLALIDAMTRFDLVAIFDPQRGIGQAWPALWWLAILVATCVFFTQIVAVVVRGGWGATRLLLGPIHFAIALAFILSLSAGVVAATDGIARGLLDLALGSPDFARVLDPPPAEPAPGTPPGESPSPEPPSTGIGAIFIDNPNLGEGLTEISRAIIMAIAGALGAVASIGFAIEMVARQAIIIVLIAVSPIAAAGLLSGATSSWWWRTARWFAAAVLLEPALALVLVIGVEMLGSASGVSGLLAGAATLLAAVFCPWAVYKLLAFVDPATGAGMDLRAITARRPAPVGTARPGAAAAEDTHAARFTEQARTHHQPGPHRAGGITGIAASARRAGNAMGGALSTGYHSVAAAGEYAGARINAQAAHTGVGHPGGVRLNRTPGTRPSPAHPAPAGDGQSGPGGAPPQVTPPATAPELDRPTPRDPADSPARGAAGRAGDTAEQDVSRAPQQRQQEQQQRREQQQNRGPRPAPASDRRSPKPPPTTTPPRPRPNPRGEQ